MPRRELSDHVQTREQVEVAPYRRFAHTKRSRRLGIVPYATVIVRHDGPEPPERGSGNSGAELRYVPFEKRLDQLTPPTHAVCFRPCQK